jgi:hypothetical protein
MPFDSDYTDKIIKFMKKAGRPVTATEIHEGVGMTRGGANYWIRQTGAPLIEPVGTGKNNGTAYVLKEDADRFPSNFRPHGAWRVEAANGNGRGNKKGGKPNFNVGGVFTLTAQQIRDGDLWIELSGPDNTMLSVNVGPFSSVP